MLKSEKKYKIGIIGLGPIGMILAVHLQEAGHEAIICDIDKVKIDLIRKEGIHLRGKLSKHGSFDNSCTNVKELKNYDPDILIFALKVHQMPAVLKEAKIFENKKCCVISAQNGIDTENILADIFGKSNTLRMVINFAGNLDKPNIVNVTFFNPPNYIASIDNSQKALAKQLAEDMNKAELQTRVIGPAELLKRVWEKTILNAALSPLCGIGRLTMKEAMEATQTAEIVKQIIEESIEVGKAEKIQFEDDFTNKGIGYLNKAGNHFPSLAVDLINNMPTEIDYMNGKIVEYGKKHAIQTPINLTFTNMVKAMTLKNLIADTATNNKPDGKSLRKNEKQTGSIKGNCFLGIDLGSIYTKFTVIDENKKIISQSILPILNRDKDAIKQKMDDIHATCLIKSSCATGYGRKYFPDSDIIKTEINCAATGVSEYFSGQKNIIDIGGEDMKVTKCDKNNDIESFFFNDKCAAGTGSFMTEIAEKADINIMDMSKLASRSENKNELNSFCTVFAKTEIMKWLFDGVSEENLAKGIYISIANRVAKLKIDPSVPVYMIGGVIAYHPFLITLLKEKFKQDIIMLKNPQYTVSLGAALTARQYFKNKTQKGVILDG